MTFMGQGTTIAKDVMPEEGEATWTPAGQDELSAYLVETVWGWSNITSLAAASLFNGSDANLAILYGAMSDGKLIEGKRDPSETEPDEIPTKYDIIDADRRNELQENTLKCMIGFALPAAWRRSGSYIFIMDAGHACSEAQDLGNYLAGPTRDSTGVCVDGHQYYLVYPDGESRACTCNIGPGGTCQAVCTDQQFSAPAGIEYISGGASYSGITTTELVRGSVRTWIANGRQNGAPVADPTDRGTMSDLMDLDVTTPGFMRIPVCSPERAFKSWDTANKDSSPNWPCDVPPGRDECGASTFEDQTSGASLKSEDCRQLIKKIKSNAITAWTTQVVGQNQREVADFGNYHSGVEATVTNDNVNFMVGGQDAIDIINDAIDRFGQDSTVSAKGYINCNSNIKSQIVLWGIY